MDMQERRGGPDESAIRMTGVVKRFGSRRVLDEIDLAVAPGEIFALLGANGAGKTTTVEILTTLSSLDGGSALVAGWDVATHPDEVRRRIALTGQSAAVDDVLSGRENLVMVARLCGLSRRRARSRAAELLERFALADAGARRAGTYSGGMRRRLDLALSFVVRPEVLFLDEPTTGLDARSRRELWQVIRSLREAGTTVLLTTQYLEEADELADRIAVLNGGRIVALGTPTELKARVGDESVEVRDADGMVRGHIPTDGSLSAVRAALDELDAAGLDGTVVLRRPTLDDVFFTLTDTPSPGDRQDRIPA
ncbi:ATP-binding cassette domain-containing protein [Microbacterium sp. ET2]|uniref:ATP-binding cassette domain-containing protein n=1 Tax=Microbacterium albipurpureum TaxID=3050384 RepID=UPI00259CF63D|nr:ATP-binding cassette domain-containing protein [Microbacterium sp. ET2 (Ac-2212)]WJL96457.1 ATP-binding cassette domain-containing protein [Microbacterium sp. ET2 (Ac-2212)]